jgi:hypothetical protein
MTGDAEQIDDVNDCDKDVLARLMCDAVGSSTHSTEQLSDSMTATDVDFGNDSKTEVDALNESLVLFDAMLLAKSVPNIDGMHSLNSSFGLLSKASSCRTFGDPTHPQRRRSVHGSTPSQNEDFRSSFQSEFRASVDDWNSELPIDDVDDDHESSFRNRFLKCNTTLGRPDELENNEGEKVGDVTVSAAHTLDICGNDTFLPRNRVNKSNSAKETKRTDDVADIDKTSAPSEKANIPRPLGRPLWPTSQSSRKSSFNGSGRHNDSAHFSWTRKKNEPKPAVTKTASESRMSRIIRVGSISRRRPGTPCNDKPSDNELSDRAVLVEGASTTVGK